MTYRNGKEYFGNLIIEEHEMFTKLINKETKKSIYIPNEELVDNTYLMDESHFQKTTNENTITKYYDYNQQKTNWISNITKRI